MLGDQRGETLLESLLAIAILAMVAVAAYAGLRVAMNGSVQHREIAEAETLLRSAAEVIQAPGEPYIAAAGCGGAPTYSGLPTRPGFSAIQVKVRFWNPSPLGAAGSLPTDFSAPGVCPADDGLQLIELRVSTPRGHVQTLEILKRRT